MTHHREPETIPELTHFVRSRFRAALLAYVILAAAAIAGLAVSYTQEQRIRDNAARVKANTMKLEQIAVCDAPKVLREQLTVDVATCQDLIARYGGHQKPKEPPPK